MPIKKRYPSDKQDQYIVRFPPGIRDLLKNEAAKNGRSLNAEIIYRLLTTIEGDAYLTSENTHADSDEATVESLMEQMQEITAHLRKILAKRNAKD